MRRVGEIAAAIGLALLVAVGVYIGIPVHPPEPGPALPSGIVAFADASPKSSPPPSFQIPPVPSRPAASAPSTADPPAVGTAIMSVRMTRPQTTGRRGEGHVAAAHPAATVAVQPRLSTATRHRSPAPPTSTQSPSATAPTTQPPITLRPVTTTQSVTTTTALRLPRAGPLQHRVTAIGPSRSYRQGSNPCWPERGLAVAVAAAG
jgi:hypothetical protein